MTFYTSSKISEIYTSLQNIRNNKLYLHDDLHDDLHFFAKY